MRWIWDANKNRANKRKHGLSFETARLVFDDPLMAHRPDLETGEERWLTIGAIGSLIVVVAHTWPRQRGATGIEVGRIISARKATAREREGL